MVNTSTTNTLIIILNWNGIEDTLLCIKSVLKMSTQAGIVVVDNGSVDDSVNILRRTYKDLLILDQKKNLGFAGGVNVGIRHAMANGYEYVALLNNDATVDTLWLKNLTDAFQLDESIGIVTGLLLNESGKTIDSTGEEYSTWGVTFSRNSNDNVTKAPPKGFVFGATGGATIYKTALFEDIGLFDEDFFAYYEDADINFRAQLAGWKVFYTPDAVAFHKKSATSKKVPGLALYHTFKNLPLLFIKDVPKGMVFSTGIRFYPTYWLILGNALIHRNIKPVLKGSFMSFILGFKKLRERRQIQHRKTVSSDYIKSIVWKDLPPTQKGMRQLRHFFTRK